MFKQMLCKCPDIIFSLLFISLQSLSTNSFSQTEMVKLPDMTPEPNTSEVSALDLNKDLKDQLIPLDSMISIALLNNPGVKAQEALIEAGIDQIKFSRREWQNGVFGSFTQSLGNQAVIFNTNQEPEAIQSSSIQSGFRVGLNVNVPLFLLFGRTSRINVYEHELEVRKQTEEKIKMEVSRQIIYEYNNMLSTHRLMLITSNSKGTTRLLSEMAEKQFSQGDISIAELSSVSAIATKAESDYEISRRDFYNNYQQLEKLLGKRLDTLVR
ncbi:MAG: TolC family protein [Bacteroidetes bacterium]|nr:TolC family protein [Bacteroidota bacterium]